MTVGQSSSRLYGVTAAVAGGVIAWNLIGNLVLHDVWYVPANLAIAGLLITMARWAGLGWDELGLARGDLGRGVVVGLAAAGVVASVIGLGLIVPTLESYFEDDRVAADPSLDRWFVPLVRIPLGTAVFEEVLFRSVLFALVMRLRGLRAALVVTSIVFGFWHIVPAWESGAGSAATAVGAIAGVVFVTTVAGVLFALLRVWSGSVVAPVLAHWATNALSYGAALLALEVIE